MVWVLQLATSLSLSLVYTVQGAPGKGHINTRLLDDVHRPRGSLWRHPLCLNKPVRAAEGVNKAGPPSLRCFACQPGDSLAWVGVRVSLPGPGRSTVASSRRSRLLLCLHAGPLEGKVLPLGSCLWFSGGSSVFLNAITAAKSNKLRTWYILWRTDPCSWISPWTGGTWVWVINKVPCNVL